MSQQSLLEVRNLCKAFGAVRAVNSVDLDVAQGDIAAIIGPNGAGKTTLFNAISGFASADSGTVRLDGHDITREAPNRIARLGLVRTFQTARPLRGATVLENVLAGTFLHGRGGLWGALFPTPGLRRAEQQSVDESVATLKSVGLLEQRNLFPDELSSGQLRLLEIARGLAARPKVLLLDEPAAGLNRQETARLEATLLAIREAGTAVLLVEHDVDMVLRVSDHVTVLDFGATLAQGKPAAIRTDPKVAQAYFGIGDADSDSAGAMT